MTTETPLARRLASPSEASTIKPILRKPTPLLGVKRRASDDDDVDSSFQLQSSPTKKRKTVVINENLNMVREISSKSLDEAKKEVRRALEGHARGADGDYDNLKELFAPPRPKSYDDDEESDEDEDEDRAEDLLAYVVALTSLAPLLGKKCSGLVKNVLKCNWLERDDKFARAYIELMAALALVQGSYLALVLGMMVDKFYPVRGQSAAVKGFPPVDAETRKERLHMGLRYMLEKFPDGGKIINDLIERKFPFEDESKTVHLEYIDHLLRLKKDRPELERNIMLTIMKRLVVLDLGMTLDLENDDDATTQAVLKQLNDPHGENGEDESDAESELSDDEDEEEAKRIRNLKSKVQTLDAILDLLFSIYTPVFENPDSPEAIETFHDLLSDFSEAILPSPNSRHTQYLLFKFALKSHQLTSLFTGALFSIASHPSTTLPLKQAAVAYLASFTARGAQVTSEQVQTITKTFLNYMDHYRAVHSGCRGPDVRKYGLYYAYFQGLLYIFCFRWRDLIDRDLVPASLDWDDAASFIGRDLPWMPWLKTRLQANIASKLNPLKCCSPVIVDEFARLSHHLRLIYIYPQIEKNKSIQLSQFFTSSYATGGALRDSGFESDPDKRQLEACFPFDPFQLPVAQRWLDLPNTYMQWKPFAILDREDDEDDDGETGEETETEENGSVQEDTATDDENNFE
ncbi:RNA polymerase I-specific transcription initiation factor RRN3 [Cercophora newfieldiana]|uniref:RNA polymerase I-specific transcription initiation factor RRN3 n=1 Tax=Cercophora newfieldiana TaxID=92897 RepID=A0AA40CZF6_9PEZI|nr:RNA polymerase I-specific transcription initiation factor RRN3 [Cercophora newfieldiana]